MFHGVRVDRTLFRFSIACFVLISGISFASTTRAATITVPAGGNLQAAINAAQPGDRIILEANKDYVCAAPCVLPVKSGTDFITIESSRYAEIPVRNFFSKQPTPEVAEMMARVKSLYSTEPVFQTAPGAHHYKLLGLDLMPSSAGQATRIVEFGTSGSAQDTLAEVPHDLVIDKSWIHSGATQEVQRCVAMNSANTEITNSWLTDCHGRGYDTQAIACWNGPGPFRIINNYLEGAGENVMFGGSPASIPNLVPSDITFRNNYVFKPLSWYVNDPSYAGIHWSVKNLFELKNARNVLIDGNIFENNWTDAQAGRSIVFTPRPSDSGTWAVIEDVQFVNNIVRNVGSGMLLLGADEPPAPTDTRLRRVRVANNLFENINGPRFGSNGAFLTVINKTEDVTIEHNTAIQTGNNMSTDYAPNTRFIYRNNITRHNEYGIIGSGHGIGNDSIAYYFPGSIVTGNLIAKEVNAPWNVDLIYPAGNYFPASLAAVGFVDLPAGNYRLASSSPYKGMGTAGTDPGCDIDTLNAALKGSSSTPLPTPTPTTSPTPEPSVAAKVVSFTLINADNNQPVELYNPILQNSVINLNELPTKNLSVRANTSGSVGSVRFTLGTHSRTEDSAPHSLYGDNNGDYSPGLTLGSHILNAIAYDTLGEEGSGLTLTFTVLFDSKKSITSVNLAKGKASTLASTEAPSSASYAGAADKGNESEAISSTTADLDSLISDIEQAYYHFLAEKNLFGAVSERIETQLLASYYFCKANRALASKVGATQSVRDHLRRIVAHLAMTEDLMIYGVITPGTGDYASAVNARAHLAFGAAVVGYGSSSSLIAPESFATILADTNLSPLSAQTLFAPLSFHSAGSYEIGGVSVSVGGQAAMLVYVSPSQISFALPPGLPLGSAEVLVISQHGYLSKGTANLSPGAFQMLTTSGQNPRALVVDALMQSFEEFDLTTPWNLSEDKRTRLTVFVSGLRGSASNADSSNDLFENGVFKPNYSESVSVEARRADGQTVLLPVEFAGAQGFFPGLDQVVFRITPSLQGAGEVQLTVIVGGQRTNAGTVKIR